MYMSNDGACSTTPSDEDRGRSLRCFHLHISNLHTTQRLQTSKEDTMSQQRDGLRKTYQPDKPAALICRRLQLLPSDERGTFQDDTNKQAPCPLIVRPCRAGRPWSPNAAPMRHILDPCFHPSRSEMGCPRLKGARRSGAIPAPAPICTGSSSSFDSRQPRGRAQYRPSIAAPPPSMWP